MIFVDVDGRFFKKAWKGIKQGWNYMWDKANQFADWAHKNRVPSANVGVNVGPDGQVQPVGFINDYPIFSNESQYEAAAQNAVDAMNEARGEYQQSQTFKRNYENYVNADLFRNTRNTVNDYLPSAANWNSGFGAVTNGMVDEFNRQKQHVFKYGKNVLKDGKYIMKTAEELTKEYRLAMGAAGEGAGRLATKSYWFSIFIDSYSFIDEPSYQQGQKSVMGVTYATFGYFFPPTIPYGIMLTLIGPENIPSAWDHHLNLYRNYNIPPKGWMR